MKRLTTFLASTALMIAMFVPAASADNQGPCNDGNFANKDNVVSVATGATGANYAKHHIAALAKIGGLGDGGHKPGVHSGFSACNPSQK